MTAQVCIVGAGAAGITMTRELGRGGIDVCVLESGGYELDPTTQALYQGISVGRDYYELDVARLRYLGGTTNHWAGVCRPLNPLVLEPRNWVDHSRHGWPLTFEELRPYYQGAQRICQLGPFEYERVPDSRLSGEPLRWKVGGVRNSLLQRSPPTRFGTEYREDLRSLESVRVFLHSNAIRLDTSNDGSTVSRVVAKDLSGKRLFVRANVFVLATGAVENARLLAIWRDVQKEPLAMSGRGLGNYFMDHVSCPAGLLLPSSSVKELSHYDWVAADEVPFRGILVPTENTLRREAMLNVHATITLSSLRSDLRAVAPGLVEAKVAWESGSFWDELSPHVMRVLADVDDVALHTYKRLFGEEGGSQPYLIAVQVEQEPTADSSVTLMAETDEFELPRAKLNWQLSGAERRTAERFVRIIGRAVGANGLGRVRSLLTDSTDWWEKHARGAWHQMGTTRMSRAPRNGVVDPDCRLHGISNFYVTGSSVFRNSGHANPTLSVVALGLRLASHLRERLG